MQPHRPITAGLEGHTYPKALPARRGISYTPWEGADLARGKDTEKNLLRAPVRVRVVELEQVHAAVLRHMAADDYPALALFPEQREYRDHHGGAGGCVAVLERH